eukprot:jgi/Astpho2/7609/Aster-x1448
MASLHKFKSRSSRHRDVMKSAGAAQLLSRAPPQSLQEDAGAACGAPALAAWEQDTPLPMQGPAGASESEWEAAHGSDSDTGWQDEFAGPQEFEGAFEVEAEDRDSDIEILDGPSKQRRPRITRRDKALAVQGLMLSLLDPRCRPRFRRSQGISIPALRPVVNWFKSTFVIVLDPEWGSEPVSEDASAKDSTLLDRTSVKLREAVCSKRGSHEQLALLFVALCRGLGLLTRTVRALEVAPLKPLGAIQLRAPPHLRERRKLQEKAAQDLAMNGTAAGKARVWTGQLQHQKLHVQAAQDLATTPIAAGNSTGSTLCKVLNQGSPKPAAKPAKKAGRGKKRKAEDEAEAAAGQDAGSALAGSRDNYQQKLPWVRMLALPQVGTAIEVGY